MIILDCEQGSPEWHKARAGVVTASEFNKIYTSTGKESRQADVYMKTLLAEWLLGGPTETYSNQWMARGQEVEDEARASYAFQAGSEVVQVGFVYADERRLIGCSPDGLMGSEGLVELKCPKASTHVDYLLKPRVPSEYVVQVQGQLMVTGRKWVDFVSYHPGMDSVVFHVERDDLFIMGLRAALERFVASMMEKRGLLRENGYRPKEEK